VRDTKGKGGMEGGQECKRGGRLERGMVKEGDVEGA
jgi:hypothetical protein